MMFFFMSNQFHVHCRDARMVVTAADSAAKPRIGRDDGREIVSWLNKSNKKYTNANLTILFTGGLTG